MSALFQIAHKFMRAASLEPVRDYIALGKIRHLFKNAEKEDFDQFDEHVRKHAAMPSSSLLKEWWGKLPDASEPMSYYFDVLRERHFSNILAKTVEAANDLVNDDKSEEATAMLVNKLTPELLRNQGNRLITIGEAYELVNSNYFALMKAGDDYAVKIGYPVVDDFGGLVAGDVLSFVGRPQAGKSFLMLRAAHRAWRQGLKPAFVSMEMNNLISGQRLVAMDAGLPLNGLKLQKGQGLTTGQMQKLTKASKAAEKTDHQFYLMDGNLSTTVEDIYHYCRHMRPDCLYVDGAYMLKHSNPRLGRFERVAENCELLKQEIAGNLGIPVVCSWQFSRDAAKKMKTKKGGALDLEDIGYSDAIGQISSIVLGLMDEENVETLHRKKVTIMKGRNGETGEFFINWQFNPVMNFDVWEEPFAGDLKFL